MRTNRFEKEQQQPYERSYRILLIFSFILNLLQILNTIFNQIYLQLFKLLHYIFFVYSIAKINIDY